MTSLPAACLLLISLVLVLYCVLIGAAKARWRKSNTPGRQKVTGNLAR
jgi:hypothetical protein